jgi:hypothetical protein
MADSFPAPQSPLMNILRSYFNDRRMVLKKERKEPAQEMAFQFPVLLEETNHFLNGLYSNCGESFQQSLQSPFANLTRQLKNEFPLVRN